MRSDFFPFKNEAINHYINLSSPVEFVYGVEKEDIKYLHELGIYNVFDLVTYYPDSYKYYTEGGVVFDAITIANYKLKDYFSLYSFMRLMRNLLTDGGFPPIKDFLPKTLREKYNLIPLRKAVKRIHFAGNSKDLQSANRRLAFNELFLMQMGLKLAKRQSLKGLKGIKFKPNGKLFEKVVDSLPFKLTSEQAKVLREIKGDMEKDTPMRRLVQGDVGCGKTIVAMLALVKAVENGYQGALMAPTEILAVQHYNNFVEMLGKFGIRIGLLSAKVTRAKKSREAVYAKVLNHELDIVVGTHAMLQNDVKFAKLGLVITDEQHRFGVSQRAKLSEKSNVTPDVLSMTATPIPRTISLTFYGDLEVSRIEKLPKGRKPVITQVKSTRLRSSVYSLLRKEILAGHQAYIVCPLRTESSIRAKSVDEIYELLTSGDTYTFFKKVPCALIHGKMKAAEKDEIMERFKKGEIKIIISTTVIEVGVNVPNATVMIIENADRFGLAQLHQLRGRVGRGSLQSYCILVSNCKNKVERMRSKGKKCKEENALKRLELMERTTNGFELAEMDLKMRGPGQFFGEKQYGMPDLKLAGVFEDMDIFFDAYNAANDFMNDAEFDEYVELVKYYIELTFKDNFRQIFNI